MFFPQLKIMGAVVFFVTVVVAMTAQAKVIIVDNDGPANFPSIQVAIDATQKGDIIQIAPGEYSEIITVQKDISLRGAKADTTILIYPKDAWPPSPLINCKNANLIIDNLTIDGQDEARYGIYAEQSTVTMSHLTIQNIFGSGIEIRNAAINLTQSVIRKTFDAIQIWFPFHSISLSNNTFTENETVIQLFGNAPDIVVTIRNNTILKNRGFPLMGIREVRLDFQDNHIKGQSTIVITSASGTIASNEISGILLSLRRCQRFSILENTITDNKGPGIWLIDSFPVIQQNLLKHNGIGILIKRGESEEILSLSPVIIQENQIIENNSGVYIKGCRSNIEILTNTITKNQQYGIVIQNTSVMMRQNQITRNSEGISIQGGEAPDIGNRNDLGLNSIYDNKLDIALVQANSTVMAIGNYWGKKDGPDPQKQFAKIRMGGRVGIDKGDIIYEPWLSKPWKGNSYSVQPQNHLITTWGKMKKH